MKKYFSVVLIALCSLTACANEQVIPFDQVPEPAKAIVAAHFDASQIAYVTMSSSTMVVRWNSTRQANCSKLIASRPKCPLPSSPKLFART